MSAESAACIKKINNPQSSDRAVEQLGGFVKLPEWTTWALLVALAICDLVAVFDVGQYMRFNFYGWFVILCSFRNFRFRVIILRPMLF